MLHRLVKIVLLLCPLLVALEAPAAPPSPRAETATMLAQLDELVKYGWWDRADRTCNAVEALLKSVKDRDLDARTAAIRRTITAAQVRNTAEPEPRRQADMIRRVQASNRNFPDKPLIHRVRAAGGGTCLTVAEALARSNDGELIELGTGTYTVTAGDLSGRSKGGKRRASVLLAAPGEWPRLIPGKDVDYTLDCEVWLDGVEVVAGRRGIASAPVHARYCSFRAEQAPASLDQGATGLPAGSEFTDCALRNFLVAAEAGRSEIARSLFLTNLVAVRAAGRAKISRCAFYRCVTGIAADGGSIDATLFSRCKSPTSQPSSLVRSHCAESADPFVDPFKGDFRLRTDAELPGSITGEGVGPVWPADRWEMFIANYARTTGPVGLAEILDGQAVAALAQAGRLADGKDYPAAGTLVADLLGRYADCPSIRKAGSEVDALADRVLRGLLAHRPAPTQPDGEPSRMAELLAQATELAATSRPDEAMAVVRKAITADPNAIEPHQLAAEISADLARPMQADAMAKRAADLIELGGASVPQAVRRRQVSLQARLAKLPRRGPELHKMMQEQAASYAKVVRNPGPPSTALACRRAALLDPDNSDYAKRLSVAESLLQPVMDAGAADPDKAKDYRAEADKQFAAREWGQAVRQRREAYQRDPSADDLLFIAKCLQKLDPKSSPAAVAALQARQAAASIQDATASGRIIREANTVIRETDSDLPRIEQMDAEFIKRLEMRRTGIESADRETAELITQLIDKLAKLDRIDPKGK